MRDDDGRWRHSPSYTPPKPKKVTTVNGRLITKLAMDGRRA